MKNRGWVVTSVASLVFAFSMIPASKLQDKIGPRFTAMIGSGFVKSRLSQMMYASSKSCTLSFTIAGVMLIVGAALTFLLKPKPAPAPAAL